MPDLHLQSLAIGVAAGAVALALIRKLRKPPRGELWASPLTTCSRRAIAACVEANVDFSFVPIHLAKGEQKIPEFVALNPYGKGPAWRDSKGFDLYESRAIMRHVSEGGPLIPASAKERALMEQWLWVDECYFRPSFAPIMYMRFLKKMPLDEKVVAEKRAELEATLDKMEERLGESTYLASESFTLADLTYLCYFQVFGGCGLADALDTRPKLKAWWQRCSTRPAWEYAVSGKVVADKAMAGGDPLGRAKPWDP